LVVVARVSEWSGNRPLLTLAATHSNLKTRTVLLTGFEPFGGESINPSEQIARELHGRTIAGGAIVGAKLPCVFSESRHALVQLLRTHQPSVVICLGLAGGRSEITPERVALNVVDARMPDNAGAEPVDVPVIRGGPAAYWSRLPIKAIVAALRVKNIPAAVSSTAGTFVCNQVFYGLMHALRWQRTVRGGFIHVPYASETVSAGQPSLPLATMTEAIAIAAEVALTTRRDLRAAGGAPN
jgi:pyroglutamyl-peptidase